MSNDRLFVSAYALVFRAGFLTPYLLPWLLLVGVGFELLESLWECHDQLDIAYNTIGILAGAALRFCLDKPDKEEPGRCAAP